jgi:hypothetical protein
MAKGVYIYVTDGGNRIKVSLDTAKAAVGGFQIPAATDQSPVVPGFGRRMRGVYVENSSGSNFFFPMATQDEGPYAVETSTNLTYKGSTLATCSRKGEKIFWGAPNPEGEAPLATTP